MRLPEFDESTTLQARLDSACANARNACTVIGRSTHGIRTFAAAGRPAAGAEREAFPTGCVTKLLAAALLEQKLGAHALHHDVPVRKVLDTAGAPAIGETTLRHLLEHRHGLDDAHVLRVPRRADGRIDILRLLALLEGRRFAAPGGRYSYSNAGAWIVAAALETLEARRFDAQLRDDLLAPLGIACRESSRAGRLAAGTLCPAMGGRLALSVGDLLTFLNACAPGAPGEGPRAGRAAGARASRTVRTNRSEGARGDDITPLPGWHPVERGVRLGWKCYDGGWLGHQSNGPGASLLVRVRPSDGAAVVVASESHHAAVVAAKVLGRELPELATFAVPKLLPAEDAARLDFPAYCGRYALAAETLDVDVDGEGLVLRGGRFRTRLAPAVDDIFFLKEGGPDRSFVQFIDRDGVRFGSLWDGRRVFPLQAPARRAAGHIGN